jgi:DNA-binding LytR/AlgR family response regulator
MSQKIKCIIVDDEPLAQQVLETFIQRIGTLELIAKCENAMEAYEVLHHEKIDVMFLDIQMPVITGVEFLRTLQNPPAVIFTTAYTDFAMEGYDLNVTDYLLKPFSFERFLKAINKATEQIVLQQQLTHEAEASNDYFFVKEDSKLVKINFQDIDHIECMKDYAKIFTKQRMIVTHHTMKKFEEVLPNSLFLRIHRSYIVSIPAIQSIFGNIVETPKGKLPVGANYKDELMKVITGNG